MFRVIAWASVAFYLLIVGVWPTAAAPVELASAGAAVVVGKLPGLFLLAAGVWLYLRHRPAPAKPTTA